MEIYKLKNEVVLQAQLTLTEINELLISIKDNDNTFSLGDLEKLKYDLDVIKKRMNG